MLSRFVIGVAAIFFVIQTATSQDDANAVGIPEIDAFLSLCWQADAVPHAVAALALELGLLDITDTFAPRVEDEDTEGPKAWIIDENVGVAISTLIVPELSLRLNHCLVSGGLYPHFHVEQIVAKLKSYYPNSENLISDGTREICSFVDHCIWKGGNLLGVTFKGGTKEEPFSFLRLVDLPDDMPSPNKPQN